MIDRVIKFLSILTSIFTIVFFLLLYTMQQGFDPGPFLRGEVNTHLSKENLPNSSTTKAIERSSEVTSSTPSIASSTPVSLQRQSTTTKLAQEAKPAVKVVVKKPPASNPVISTPLPLIVEKPVIVSPTSTLATSSEPGSPNAGGALNQKDILVIVNQEREKEGLLPLGFNKRLSAIAEGKAVDMINKQYFAHVSPKGVDVAALAKIYGYQYIYLGENLAMGDFSSSAEVMTGWMNSPGHRANILNKNYSEVGIAVLEGGYQGRVVWYAVQEFGRPLSSCPSPENALEAKIIEEEALIKASEQTLTTLRVTIEQSSGDPAVYNALVEQFNALVDKYNTLAATTKNDIATFNKQVSAFNLCIGVNATTTQSVIGE